MTLEELESDNATLKRTEATRARAFQIVIWQVKTGVAEATGTIESLPDGSEKTAALKLLKSLEAKANALLAADYEGAMNAVQPEAPTTAEPEPEQHVALPDTTLQVSKTETE